MSDLVDIEGGAARELARFESEHGKAAASVSGPLATNIKKLKSAVSAARREVELSGLPLTKKREIEAQLVEASRADLAELMAAERERVASALAKEKRAIEKERAANASKYDREAQAAALRFAAMSKKELLAEADRFIANPTPMLPAVIDALSAAVKQADPHAHEALRNAVVSENRYDSERFTETGSKIVRHLAAIDAALTRGAEVVVPTADGAFQVLRLSDVVGANDD